MASTDLPMSTTGEVADGRIELGRDGTPENRQLIYDKPDDVLVSTLRRWFLEDQDAKNKDRERKVIDWRMYNNDQWEEEAKNRAISDRRPILTLNYILPTISAIEGEERSNRQEIKVYGRRGEDDQGAEAFNLLIRWIMNECNGEYAMSTAFRHMAVCGEGWLLPDVDYFGDPDGQIIVRHVDEGEITNDCQDLSPDASESRRLTRHRWVKDDELEAMFPGSLAKVYAATGGEGSFDTLGRETDGRGYRDIYTTPGQQNTKVYDAKKRSWLLLEHWWYEIAPGYAVHDPATDQIVELTIQEGDALRKKAANDIAAHVAGVSSGMVPPDMPPPTMPNMVQRPIRRYYQAFTCHNVLLEKRPHPVPECRRIPYVPVYGYLNKIEKEWFGAVRSIIDAQRQHNVEQSSIVHMIQQLPKSGWMAPRGGFHNRQRWENAAAQPGVTLEYNIGKKPEPLQQPAVPRHLIDMAMSRMQTMRDISGVNIEMTGNRQGDDAGVVMEMRKKAALTMLAPLFDNYRLSKKVLGKLLIAYIQKYVPVGRRIRVIGPTGDGAQLVEMSRDMAFGRYDAIIDETTATVNDRIQTLTLLQTVLPTIIDAGIPIPPSFVDLFPIPPNVRAEWKAMIFGQMQQQQMTAQTQAAAMATAAQERAGGQPPPQQ